MKTYLAGLRLIAGSHRTRLTLLLLAALTLNGLLTVLNPMFLKWECDEGIIRKDFGVFVWTVVGFLALVSLWRLLEAPINLRLQRLKDTIVRERTAGLLAKFYRLPYQEVNSHGAAYYTARIFDEPREAIATAIDLALSLSKSMVALVVAAVLALTLSPHLTGILLVVVAPVLYLAARYGRVIEKQTHEEMDKQSCVRDYLSKSVLAHRPVSLFALQPRVIDGFRGLLMNYSKCSFARFKSTCLHNLLSVLLITHEEMLLIVVCSYEVFCDRMTFGGLLAFCQAFWIAIGAVRTLTQAAPEIAKVNALVRRLLDLELHDDANPPVLSTDGRIELERACMSFDDNVVFSDLSFAIASGEKVMLRGRNGSGKSTVANLIAGFLEPSKGTVTTIPLARFSACIAPHYFIPGTVRDNLQLPDVRPAETAYLQRLVKQLDLRDCLDKFPEDLSAGQKKKAEVAMCLLKEADTYLFDEPLANVDVESKDAIMRLVFERSQGKSLIVVMHGDAEFHARFDRVVDLQRPKGRGILPGGGRFVDSGSLEGRAEAEACLAAPI